MKRLLTIISLVTLLASCNSTSKKTTNMEDQKNQTDNSNPAVDIIPKVTGIGGISFIQTI
jgi:hypothetical protein